MKGYDFIDNNIGERVYLTGNGDLGMDSKNRKYMPARNRISTIPELTIVKRTKSGLAYLKGDNEFLTVPIRNVRLYSELIELNSNSEEGGSIFILENDLLNRVIREIDNFYGFELGDSNMVIRNSITKIEASYQKEEKILEIKIETKRPGIIIGRGGKCIDSLKSYLQKELKTEGIQINLVENKLEWYSNLGGY